METTESTSDADLIKDIVNTIRNLSGLSRDLLSNLKPIHQVLRELEFFQESFCDEERFSLTSAIKPGYVFLRPQYDFATKGISISQGFYGLGTALKDNKCVVLYDASKSLLSKSKIQYMVYKGINLKYNFTEELLLVPECRIKEFLMEEKIGLFKRLSELLEMSSCIISSGRSLSSYLMQDAISQVLKNHELSILKKGNNERYFSEINSDLTTSDPNRSKSSSAIVLGVDKPTQYGQKEISEKMKGSPVYDSTGYSFELQDDEECNDTNNPELSTTSTWKVAKTQQYGRQQEVKISRKRQLDNVETDEEFITEASPAVTLETRNIQQRVPQKCVGSKSILSTGLSSTDVDEDIPKSHSDVPYDKVYTNDGMNVSDVKEECHGNRRKQRVVPKAVSPRSFPPPFSSYWRFPFINTFPYARPFISTHLPPPSVPIVQPSSTSSPPRAHLPSPPLFDTAFDSVYSYPSFPPLPCSISLSPVYSTLSPFLPSSLRRPPSSPFSTSFFAADTSKENDKMKMRISVEKTFATFVRCTLMKYAQKDPKGWLRSFTFQESNDNTTLLHKEAVEKSNTEKLFYDDFSSICDDTIKELADLKDRTDFMIGLWTGILINKEKINQYSSISRYTHKQFTIEQQLTKVGEMVRSEINSIYPGVCRMAIPAFKDKNKKDLFRNEKKTDCILVMFNDESQRPGRIDIMQYTKNQSLLSKWKIDAFNFCISTDEFWDDKTSEQNNANIDEMQRIIQRYSQELICNHSNIEVIRIGYKRINGTAVRAIEINCQHKGYIPMGEEEFPSELGGYPVCVKEAYLSDVSGSLCLACKGEMISNEKNSCGSLGPFVSNGTDDSFLTCAHVVCESDVLLRHISMDKGSILQTIPDSSKKIFHKVSEEQKERFAGTTALCYGDVDWNGRACGVDMAVVTILNDFSPANKRESKQTGLIHWPYYSLSKPSSNDCKATDLVYKCGGTTGLTVGKLQVHDGSDKICFVTCTSRLSQQRNGSYLGAYAFKNQYEIVSAQKSLFVDLGDSGSTLFVYNEREKAIRPIGMIIKMKKSASGSVCRTTDCVAYATPIEALEIALQNIDQNYSFLTLENKDSLELATPVKCISSEIEKERVCN